MTPEVFLGSEKLERSSGPLGRAPLGRSRLLRWVSRILCRPHCPPLRGSALRCLLPPLCPKHFMHNSGVILSHPRATSMGRLICGTAEYDLIHHLDQEGTWAAWIFQRERQPGSGIRSATTMPGDEAGREEGFQSDSMFRFLA